MDGAFDSRPGPRVVFGLGTLGRLGELATELLTEPAAEPAAGSASGGRPLRVLLVTDRGLVAAGHAARATAALESSGAVVAAFDAVRENPTADDVEACAAAARELGPDLLVGLGGGSAIDVAKGANLLLAGGGRVRDYWGVGLAKGSLLPLVAVPTTAGTGTDAQSFALIADPKTHQKMACGDPRLAPRLAVLDPELTVTQPPVVTACTGLDAIGHAVETAVTKARTPVSSMYSREAFRLANAAFPRVLAEPTDLAARGDMLLAAAFAGTAIENSMLGAAHSMANPLTARFDVAHGQAVALALPHVVRFNAAEPGSRELYAELARAAGLAPEAEALAERLEELQSLAGLPRTLRECGVPAGRSAELAEEAARQWTARFNPRPVGVDELRSLFDAADGP